MFNIHVVASKETVQKEHMYIHVHVCVCVCVCVCVFSTKETSEATKMYYSVGEGSLLSRFLYS